MDLNYHHLKYFWATAREGNLTRASQRLRVAPSTVSAQIKTLEATLGHPLFERRGRGLGLTERGQMVMAYADEIFGLGQELVDAVRSKTGPKHAYRFRVGLGNDVPKLQAWHLLSPCLRMDDLPVHLVVHEDRADRLVADLATHHFDLVLVDAPVALASEVRVESVLLGESGVTLLASPKLAAGVLAGFPQSLHEAPLLLPEVGSELRRVLEEFFTTHEIRPRVVAEIGDSALLKAFGQEGAGVFAVPSAVAVAVQAQYHVVPLGELEEARQRIYAMVMPNRRANPAVEAVIDAGVAARTGTRVPPGA
ncbi:MAG: LysR family transcriptional regulator [Deltaproteobacteria bacterium]|nr:LysR family transcriptional regulator [Deltaproteobacteria bacterium]